MSCKSATLSRRQWDKYPLCLTVSQVLGESHSLITVGLFSGENSPDGWVDESWSEDE